MTDSRSPVIELDQVQFSWKQGSTVLDISQLTIYRGEKVFIRGPSGSGKTTLLGLLGGVLVPERGSVDVLGTNLCSLSPAQRDHFRANHIGFIFQMFNLIPYLSLVDNVTLPLSFSQQRQQQVKQSGSDARQEALRLLSHLGLNDQKQLNNSVTELSIGQQQRVAAARAMIGRPGIVIADEPTSALDTDTREAFIQLLFEECEAAENTLVFVSHDPTLEQLFDRTIALHEINHARSGSSTGGDL
ncbi:methionine ABC transporter ATP-binding protein [Endozoicomonas montiporae]|uniref:Methionine ABC transporter ATP-binding protein n=2 Tax=Endozoicomonas montiporae TaxID=1027273 RepID=A0A081N8W6_9GAMM|nr:ABC transporter ATP-binding protein [Endozoicomonas montiporae]AMO55189.1 ABC transport system ATP-binding protein [Endozoicomonas montiporae CL-33]KEQ14889.1 methionine ABC transporter ATP-binding protein [Endozoicomonas montiporae]